MISRRSFVPYLVLAGGVLVVATAAILIRSAQQLGVPSLTIAAGRMLLAALVLLPLAIRYSGAELARFGRREWLLGVSSGVFLAVHFAAWISSLAFTSVASSVALVATNPLWVGLFSVLVLREKRNAAVWLAIGLTVVGSALIGLSDSSGPNGQNALLGNGLALLGAVTASGYFLLGRTLRRHASLLSYITVSYGTAALILLLVVLAGAAWRSEPLASVFELPTMAYLLLLGLAVGPQLLGHTAFNWSLKYLSATFVAVAVLGEPIASALLALLVFGEWFRPLQLAGFVLLLAGIVLAARSEDGAGKQSEE